VKRRDGEDGTTQLPGKEENAVIRSNGLKCTHIGAKTRGRVTGKTEIRFDHKKNQSGQVVRHLSHPPRVYKKKGERGEKTVMERILVLPPFLTNCGGVTGWGNRNDQKRKGTRDQLREIKVFGVMKRART